MYRFLIYFLLLVLLSPSVLTANAQTIVTRRPVYNRYNNRNFHHNHCRNFHNNNYSNRYYRKPHRNIINNRNNSFFNNNRRFYNTPGFSTSFSDLGMLENYTLNRNFNKESDLERLERLEMQAFGAIQSGDINSRYDNVRTAILSRPQPTRVKNSLFRTIGNFFGGQMTGFSPSFDNDPFFADSFFNQNQYPSTYGTQSAASYSRPFGGGSRIQNYGTGSTCGVQLLD